MKIDRKVLFELPDIESYSKKGLDAIDMHVHTKYSDGISSVKNILSIIKKREFNVAITDHNEIKGAMKAVKNSNGSMVIPGIEVSAGDGPHLLFYFYSANELESFFEKHIKKSRPRNPNLAIGINSKEILDISMDYNCVRSAAHLFGYGITNIGVMKCLNKGIISRDIMKKFDAMEVFCGGIPHISNIKAKEYALSNNFGITGGTDSHIISNLGRGISFSESAGDVSIFLDNVIKKRNFVVGKECGVIEKMKTGICVSIEHMKHPLVTLKTQLRTHGKRKNKV